MNAAAASNDSRGVTVGSVIPWCSFLDCVKNRISDAVQLLHSWPNRQLEPHVGTLLVDVSTAAAELVGR
jgi:hypothetical protein